MIEKTLETTIGLDYYVRFIENASGVCILRFVLVEDNQTDYLYSQCAACEDFVKMFQLNAPLRELIINSLGGKKHIDDVSIVHPQGIFKVATKQMPTQKHGKPKNVHNSFIDLVACTSNIVEMTMLRPYIHGRSVQLIRYIANRRNQYEILHRPKCKRTQTHIHTPRESEVGQHTKPDFSLFSFHLSFTPFYLYYYK